MRIDPIAVAGAVLVGAFNDAELKTILSLSQQEVPMHLIAVGKP